jgi:hypothetical protein
LYQPVERRLERLHLFVNEPHASKVATGEAGGDRSTHAPGAEAVGLLKTNLLDYRPECMDGGVDLRHPVDYRP